MNSIFVVLNSLKMFILKKCVFEFRNCLAKKTYIIDILNDFVFLKYLASSIFLECGLT